MTIKILLCFISFILLSAQSSSGFDVGSYVKKVLLMSNDPIYQKDFDEHLKYVLSLDKNYFDYESNLKFDCDTSSSLQENNDDAITVHSLRPSDIKVVAAIGDSLTAALGGTILIYLVNKI